MLIFQGSEIEMADPNSDVVILDPRRNQSMEKKKLFQEMLLKEIPGFVY